MAHQALTQCCLQETRQRMARFAHAPQAGREVPQPEASTTSLESLSRLAPAGRSIRCRAL